MRAYNWTPLLWVCIIDNCAPPPQNQVIINLQIILDLTPIIRIPLVIHKKLMHSLLIDQTVASLVVDMTLQHASVGPLINKDTPHTSQESESIYRSALILHVLQTRYGVLYCSTEHPLRVQSVGSTMQLLYCYTKSLASDSDTLSDSQAGGMVEASFTVTLIRVTALNEKWAPSPLLFPP